MTRPSASGCRGGPRGAGGRTRRCATSTMPQRHGRPNESDTMTGTSTPNRSRIAGPDRLRGRVGVARQQRHQRTRAGPHVRRVDAAVGADEPMRRFGDQDAVGHAHDATRLAQDDLDLARIAVPASRRSRSPRAAARRSSGRRRRPRPWRRPSGSRPARRPSVSGRTPGVRSMASPISAARSSPGRISGIPSRARTRDGTVSRQGSPPRRSTRRARGRPGVSMSKISGPSIST